MDDLGWGRPMGVPGHAADVERAVKVFADGVDVLARMLGVAVDSTRCVVTFAAATKDLDLPGRPIATGGVAGIDVRWSGSVGGREVVELAQRWVMGQDLSPEMPVEHGYLIEVDADPQVRAKVDIWPDQDLATLTPESIHAIGMRITGVPVVNAIPAVCAADPGLRTYADLPLISGRLVVDHRETARRRHCPGRPACPRTGRSPPGRTGRSPPAPRRAPPRAQPSSAAAGPPSPTLDTTRSSNRRGHSRSIRPRNSSANP